MFPRTSSLVKLVRPASQAINRGVRPNVKAPVLLSNSGFGSAMPTRSIATSTSILNQASTLADTAATVNSTFARPNLAEEPLVSSESEDASTPKLSTETVMAEYAGKKAAGPLGMSEYEAVLKSLAYNRSFPEAYAVLQDMRGAGLKPSATAYGMVLRAGRRSLRIPEIRELFGHKLENRYSKEGANEEAQEEEPSQRQASPHYETMKQIKAWMAAEGVELEAWFWDDVAAWLSSINNAGLLINVAIAMETRGVVPSPFFYTKMLHTLPRAGFAERSDVLFSRMVHSSIADVHAYVVHLGSLVYLNRFNEAEKLFGELRAKFELNEVAYNTIIHGYLNAKKVDKALALLEEFKADGKAKPGNITATTFLAYFYETGDIKHANEVLGYFREATGFPASQVDNANLLKFFGRYEPARACQMIAEAVKDEAGFGVPIYNAIINLLVDRKIMPEWKRTIGEAVLDREYPLKLGGLAEKCSKLPYHVRHLLARMEANGVAPNSVTYDLLMRGLLNRREYSAAIDLYAAMDAGNIPMFASHRNAYLTALIASGAPTSEIGAFLETMRFRRWPISAQNNRRLAEAQIKVPFGAFVYQHDKFPAVPAAGPEKPGFRAARNYNE
jgi:pentatricopeptide repeat protein